jgi:hypothetical protein
MRRLVRVLPGRGMSTSSAPQSDACGGRGRAAVVVGVKASPFLPSLALFLCTLLLLLLTPVAHAVSRMTWARAFSNDGGFNLTLSSLGNQLSLRKATDSSSSSDGGGAFEFAFADGGKFRLLGSAGGADDDEEDDDDGGRRGGGSGGKKGVATNAEDDEFDDVAPPPPALYDVPIFEQELVSGDEVRDD